MKILRLGFTESTLLYIHWYLTLSKIKIDNNGDITKYRKNMMNWLHSTSGYYDKCTQGTYFNFDEINEPVFAEYMNYLITYISGADLFSLHLHGIGIPQHEEEFKTFLKCKELGAIGNTVLYNFMEKDRTLLITPFAELIADQIKTGNVKKIYDIFPNNVTVVTYAPPYTFFNNGPHNNILETKDDIFANIKRLAPQFDKVVISCGAYSCLLAGKIHDELHKDVLVIGGELTLFFGIASQRMIEHGKTDLYNEEYWIKTIPEKYKPDNYKLIENGCYW